MANLHITEPGAMLHKRGGQLVVIKGEEELLAVPAAQVESVVVLAGAGVTTPALTFLLTRGIGLVLLSASGAYRGRLTGDLPKNVALRRQQYRRADDGPFALALARTIVAGKLANCRVRCLEMAGSADPAGLAAAGEIKDLIARAALAGDHAALMGIEGEGTQRYWDVYRRALRPPWVFERRQRRPPPDPVNALLSLLSTFLHGTCVGALETVGLDPSCGFLHQEHYGRSSLALDLMEEFRPLLADALTMTLLNKRMVHPRDFGRTPDKGIRLHQRGWEVVVTQYQKRLNDRIRSPRDDTSITWLQLIEGQARQLRATIEGDAPVYLPYRAR